MIGIKVIGLILLIKKEKQKVEKEKDELEEFAEKIKL